MNLSISQIAWRPEEEEKVARLLNVHGISEVELAPPRIFSDPENPDVDEMYNCLNFWADFNITPIAFQALLFGRQDLNLFSDSNSRENMFNHLSGTIVAAGQMGIRNLVFGSPKNRFVPESMTKDKALDIATDFFSRLGDVAFRNGTRLCIEPNPQAYGCNFVTTSAQGVELVQRVASPGFGLHLDLAGMWLEGEDIPNSLASSFPHLGHFHLSAPDLGLVTENGLPYSQTVSQLVELGYLGSLSIEMRSGDDDNSKRALHSIEYVSKIMQRKIS